MESARANVRDRLVESGPVSSWSASAAKRIFDVTLASAALIVAAPAFAVTALAVKASSEGPILFRQVRTGKHGRTFEILKFRTMRLHAAGSGPSVTVANDERLTRVGRLLRRTKLDEVPQLLNIVKGDMSFVGPRPKVPHHQRYVLPVRPGITGAASLAFRNEEHMLHGIPSEELDNVQVTVLMPRKRALDEAYMSNATFFTDLAMIFRTAVGKNLDPGDEIEDLDRFRRSLTALAFKLHDEDLKAKKSGAEQELRVA